jgi:hypothetical protein
MSWANLVRELEVRPIRKTSPLKSSPSPSSKEAPLLSSPETSPKIFRRAVVACSLGDSVRVTTLLSGLAIHEVAIPSTMMDLA